MSFVVRYNASARDDLTRLFDHPLDRAATVEDLDIAERALAAITGAIENLRRSPFICRKAGDDPFLRELPHLDLRAGGVAATWIPVDTVSAFGLSLRLSTAG